MNPTHARHLVVDGSNIATEGRTTPSLAQLDEAVAAVAEQGFDPITVIVDATFPRRIDKSEVDEFERRVLEGQLVTPPAGVVGRGDAFILQVAVEADAVVLSNDSFQEFHGEHEWLLSEEGRLLGGKPVPNVGWVFALRSPVRGEISQQAVRQAKRERKSASKSGDKKTATAGTKRAKRSESGRAKTTQGADDSSTARKDRGAAGSRGAKGETGRGGESTSQKRAKRQAAVPGEASATAGEARQDAASSTHLNDIDQFMTFVRSYSIGDTLEGTVERYSSHGCYLRAATAQCYLPSKAMGDPPPNRARDVVSRGQTVRVKVESLDAQRRGINVSLVSVIPEAERTGQEQPTPSNSPRSETTMAAPKKAAKKRTTRKAAAQKAPAKRTTKKAAAKKAPAKRTTKKAAAKRTAAKRTPARRASAKRTTKKA